MGLDVRAEGSVESHDGERELRWQAMLALRDQITAIVGRRVADPADAEDFVHDAMLRLLERDGLDRDPKRLRALMARTASALAIDAWRRRNRYAHLLGHLAASLDHGDGPDQVVAKRSEAAWLVGGFADLGAMERAAILHTIAGLRIDEISELLGVGYKAVENALGRARRKLRVRAAAVTVSVAALLRRWLSRPEAAPILALAPVGILLLSGGGAATAAAASRAHAPVVATLPTGGSRPPARVDVIAGAAAAGAHVVSVSPATVAASAVSPNGVQPQPSPSPQILQSPIQSKPPSEGQPIIGVGGKTLVLGVGPSDGVVSTYQSVCYLTIDQASCSRSPVP